MIDEPGKNARRIFYVSLTNSGTLKYSCYNCGYYTYIDGYSFLLTSIFLLFIIGTKLSIQSLIQNLLCKTSKIIRGYNFCFRLLVQSVLRAGSSDLPPAGYKARAVLWNIVTDICTIIVLLSNIFNTWMESSCRLGATRRRGVLNGRRVAEQKFANQSKAIRPGSIGGTLCRPVAAPPDTQRGEGVRPRRESGDDFLMPLETDISMSMV